MARNFITINEWLARNTVTANSPTPFGWHTANGRLGRGQPWYRRGDLLATGPQPRTTPTGWGRPRPLGAERLNARGAAGHRFVATSGLYRAHRDLVERHDLRDQAFDLTGRGTTIRLEVKRQPQSALMPLGWASRSG